MNTNDSCFSYGEIWLKHKSYNWLRLINEPGRNKIQIRKQVVKPKSLPESFANANTIVFDKTGTLTAACPQVAKVIPYGSRSRNEVLKISACLEEHFPHSVAKAIVKQAEIENLSHKEEHAEVEYIVAHGISSMLYGQRTGFTGKQSPNYPLTQRAGTYSYHGWGWR